MDAIPFPFPWPEDGTLPLVAAGLLTRVVAVTEIAAPTILPGVGVRSRFALAVLVAGAALPAALAAAPIRAAPPTWGTFLTTAATEAGIGIALGLAVAALVGVVTWAGEILGGAAGLAWTDGVEEEAAEASAGVPRLARSLALAAFLAAGGLGGTVATIVDGVRTLPIGTAPGPAPLETVAIQATAAAVSLAVALALPALVGLLVFHVVVALVIRVGACDPGPGLLHGATALLLIAMLCHGAPAWWDAAGARLVPALAGHLDAAPASSGGAR